MKQPQPLILANDIVTLKPMTMAMVEDFYRAGKPEQIWQWTQPYQCESLATATRWVETGLAAVERGEQVMFAIIDNATGRFVGSTRYLSIDVVNSTIEIGYTWVNPEFQRSHINSNCKLLLLTHAFEALGAVRVQLRTHKRNQKSRNAISRLGMQFEGIFRHNILLSTGEYRDTAMFSMLRDEWPQAKQRLMARIAGSASSVNAAKAAISDTANALMQEAPFAQIVVASNDNLLDQIIYLPLQLDRQRGVLTGHMASDNKLAWLLENSPRVVVVFDGGDNYVSPQVHAKQLVPTWNYRKLHISGQFSFLSTDENEAIIKAQVAQFEGGKNQEMQWQYEQQSPKLMATMLSQIRCFEIAIEQIQMHEKLSKHKPFELRKAIADELVADGQLSLANAHLD
ncbi:GNAT family N-acetyltransferase [Psychrobium sp. MM17-31]|uniref:GNAT family N-acetyltransferase n=1 Tax=Psychrobium sp. MM17-31 TaxID=2917758 RepID=UPI001EF4CBBB|nr:GNAT family N-acetyltransferase [Psychrobium sp. MM17-31]MCG7532717.1 GNAT family N-acetyltransferase [Psychrobium sp. MM17-31]